MRGFLLWSRPSHLGPELVHAPVPRLLNGLQHLRLPRLQSLKQTLKVLGGAAFSQLAVFLQGGDEFMQRECVFLKVSIEEKHRNRKQPRGQMQTRRRDTNIVCIVRLERGAPHLGSNNDWLFHSFAGWFCVTYQNVFILLVKR